MNVFAQRLAFMGVDQTPELLDALASASPSRADVALKYAALNWHSDPQHVAQIVRGVSEHGLGRLERDLLARSWKHDLELSRLRDIVNGIHGESLHTDDQAEAGIAVKEMFRVGDANTPILRVGRHRQRSELPESFPLRGKQPPRRLELISAVRAFHRAVLRAIRSIASGGAA